MAMYTFDSIGKTVEKVDFFPSTKIFSYSIDYIGPIAVVKAPGDFTVLEVYASNKKEAKSLFEKFVPWEIK